MDEIVLKTNLKYVLAALNMSERGELLTALLDGAYNGENLGVRNVYNYIFSLQQETKNKKQRMRELSAKGVAARFKKAIADSSAVEPSVNQRLLRKEAKEYLNIEKNNINLFSDSDSDGEKIVFVPPTLKQVKDYIAQKQLKVDAENFLNFYESHGWMVGKTPIKNWQATLKLWHTRAVKTVGKALLKVDESYWSELAERVTKKEPPPEGDILSANISCSARQNLPPELHHQVLAEETSSPFARFMRRVEKYDIQSEGKND